jgi:sporulation protein YlmC with PRC-barrel domain
MRLELGSPVRCSDDVFGEIADVVVDPIAKRVTHLVVQPHNQHGLARLVPVALADPDDRAQPEISLRCTVEEVRRLAPVQEFAYLQLGEFPVNDPDWDVGVQDVLAMPYYGASGFGGYSAELDPHVGISYDRVPKGEVEIRRSSRVTSSDGHDVGHVDGLLVDRDEQITHLVLDHGHLWGHREVTIPIGAVTKVETDAVTLSLSKDEVGALEPITVQRWSS